MTVLEMVDYHHPLHLLMLGLMIRTEMDLRNHHHRRRHRRRHHRRHHRHYRQLDFLSALELLILMVALAASE
jgi:hypothetical protein